MHSYFLNCKFVEQKVNVSRVKLLRGKHLLCCGSVRNDRYLPWGVLAVAIITPATKTEYMDESWSLSGITSASIYSSCSFARCTRYKRSCPQKKFDFIFIGFVNACCVLGYQSQQAIHSIKYMLLLYNWRHIMWWLLWVGLYDY